jgi:hypothetical protein
VQSSGTTNKSLFATVKGTFQVVHDKKIILETKSADLAVEKFNSI